MIDRITAALSRRNLLMGLAASATAATMAEAGTGPQENPELIAMADALPGVLAEYVAARDHVRAIVAEWSPQWPVPSEEIIRYSDGCKDYRDITGRGIQMPWGNTDIMKMPMLGTPEHFEASAKRHEAQAVRRASLKSQRGLKFHLAWAEADRAGIEPARAFWAEVERITVASGIGASKARETAARDTLKVAVDRIMLADDWTITGAVIKAQALSTWATVEEAFRLCNVRGPAWADLLAASIVKHAA